MTPGNPCPSDVELGARRWAGRTGRLRILGLDIEIVAERPEVTDYLRQVFAPFRADGDARHLVALVEEADGYAVAHAGRWVLAPSTIAQAVVLLIWWVNQRSLESPWHELLVHAGVVSLDGRAVLIPGEPDAGKSTLTAALVQHGFDYLSDEAARIDLRTGLVAPFPRCLALDATSLDLLGLDVATAGFDVSAFPEVRQLGAHVPPERLRRRPHGDPARPALVAFPQVSRAAQPGVTPVGRGSALSRLVGESLNLHLLGRPGFAGLTTLVERVTLVELCYGDLTDGVALIRHALSTA